MRNAAFSLLGSLGVGFLIAMAGCMFAGVLVFGLFSFMASRSSSSSTSFPAPSMALRSVASVKRGGGLVWLCFTSMSFVSTTSFGWTGARVGVSSLWASLP